MALSFEIGFLLGADLVSEDRPETEGFIKISGRGKHLNDSAIREDCKFFSGIFNVPPQRGERSMQVILLLDGARSSFARADAPFQSESDLGRGLGDRTLGAFSFDNIESEIDLALSRRPAMQVVDQHLPRNLPNLAARRRNRCDCRNHRSSDFLIVESHDG